MNSFMNKDGGPYDWNSEMGTMTAEWCSLVLAKEDTIPGSEMTYKDLNEALPNIMHEKNLPA